MRPSSVRLVFAALTLLAAAGVTDALPLRVVATLPAYSSIAQLVGGKRVAAESIARGDEDAHFVKPKPSYALQLQRADLFVTTGLDLELWAPVLLEKSGNPRLRDGQPAYVSASQGVPLLDVPVSADRAAGDVHIFGNPHVFTSPLNAKQIAANIAAGLARVDPQGASAYQAGLAAFSQRIDESLYGGELVALLGSATLDPLARQGKLLPFLDAQQYDGRPLRSRLGGWLGRLAPYAGQPMITYHKNWVYLTELFSLRVVDTVEPKPGIPPSARHVHDLVEAIQQQHIRVLLAASYFPQAQVDAIAERTGCRAVVVPLGPPEGTDYFALIDRWVNGLADAFAGGS